MSVTDTFFAVFGYTWFCVFTAMRWKRLGR